MPETKKMPETKNMNNIETYIKSKFSMKHPYIEKKNENQAILIFDSANEYKLNYNIVVLTKKDNMILHYQFTAQHDKDDNDLPTEEWLKTMEKDKNKIIEYLTHMNFVLK